MDSYLVLAGKCRSLLSDLLLPELAGVVVEYLEGTLGYLGKWGNQPPGWEEDYLRCNGEEERQLFLEKHPTSIYHPHRLWASSRGIVVCNRMMLPRMKREERKTHHIRVFEYGGSSPSYSSLGVEEHCSYIITCSGRQRSSNRIVVFNGDDRIRIEFSPALIKWSDIVCDESRTAFLPGGRVAICVENGVSIFDAEGHLIDRTGELCDFGDAEELGEWIEPIAITASGNTLFVVGSGGFHIHMFQVW